MAFPLSIINEESEVASYRLSKSVGIITEEHLK